MSVMSVMSVKTCPKCDVERSLDGFAKHRSRSDGLSSWCKPCMNEYSKARYAAGKNEKYRYRKYGLTLEDYESLVLGQQGFCACCGEMPDKMLVVDHCHETGEIRGLLCHKCNTGIGQLGDNIEGLRKALKYLSNDVCESCT